MNSPKGFVRQKKIYHILSKRNKETSNVQCFDDMPVEILPDIHLGSTAQRCANRTLASPNKISGKKNLSQKLAPATMTQCESSWRELAFSKNFLFSAALCCAFGGGIWLHNVVNGHCDTPVATRTF